MGKPINAFTVNTAKNLQLDAGMLVRGLANPMEFNGTLATPAKSIGATSGGGSFTAIPEMRNIFEDLDGSRGNYKDGNVIDSWEIKLTITLKEVTAENLKLSLAAADTKAAAVAVPGMVNENEEAVAAVAAEKFDTTTGRLEIKTADYLDNLCWIGTLNGSAEPIIIELKNVLNINGLNFTFADKSSGGVELELQAHFDLAKPDEVPFKIYTPKLVA